MFIHVHVHQIIVYNRIDGLETHLNNNITHYLSHRHVCIVFLPN